MNKIEQGVFRKSRLINWLVSMILLFIFFISPFTYAKEIKDISLENQLSSQKHQLFISYSSNRKFQSKVAQNLSEIILDNQPDLHISLINVDDKNSVIKARPDVIIAIGNSGLLYANKYYPGIDKLILSTDTEYNKLEIVSGNDAILYMAQPYCRQIQFINLFNDQWKTISLIYSKEKLSDIKAIQQCAKNNHIDTYVLETTESVQLTENIKKALTHSDLLLALPDKNIYNSKTVKNILLTSYRFRKPLIAFSNNFVNAGATASIYSTTEQIAQDAGNLIEFYYKQGRQFSSAVNYPVSFDISINRQVLRALDLPSPDTAKLKQILRQSETDKKGDLK